MTIVVSEKENVLNQIIKQLDKLIDVIQVIDFREGDYVGRELVLLQVKVDRQSRAEVIEICQLFRAKIIDVGRTVLTIEITGDSGKIDKFTSLMDAFGIINLTRTGRIALPRLNEAPEETTDAGVCFPIPVFSTSLQVSGHGPALPADPFSDPPHSP